MCPAGSGGVLPESALEKRPESSRSGSAESVSKAGGDRGQTGYQVYRLTHFPAKHHEVGGESSGTVPCRSVGHDSIGLKQDLMKCEIVKFSHFGKVLESKCPSEME